MFEGDPPTGPTRKGRGAGKAGATRKKLEGRARVRRKIERGVYRQHGGVTTPKGPQIAETDASEMDQ